MENMFFRRLDELSRRTRSVARGALVFERGDPVNGFVRVLSGEVHLLRRQADGAGFVLQRAGAGDILAEASISTARYHCAAEAVADSVLAIWPAGRVRALLQEDHRAAEGYALHLAAQLRKERMRAEILSLRRVGDRLDAWLAWHDGKMPKKGGLARLAGDLNVSAPALYRELARRRAAGWAPG